MSHTIRMFWIFLLFPLALFAGERNLSSDLPMEFDGKTNSVVAKQNATFVDNDLMVVADEIRYSKNDDTATATGNVRMNFHGSRLVAEKLTYQMKEHRFSAENFRLGFFPYMISGKRVSGTPDKLVIENATLYGSQTGSLAPNMYAMRMTLEPRKRSTQVNMQAGLAKVGPAPLLPIPALWMRVPRAESLHMDMELGNSKTYGTFLRTQSLWPVADNFKAGANLDYYTKRGWLAGPKFLYETSNVYSELSSGYISDRGNRGQDLRSVDISQERGFVDWRHKQRLGELQLTQQVQYWSDSEVLRDFRPKDFRENQAPESFTEAVLPWHNTYISLFARYDPNNFDLVPVTMPELRIDRTPSAFLNTGIYYSSYNSFAHIEQGAKSYDRYDGIFSLERPTALTPWWQINPVAAVRETYYSDPSGATISSGSVSRTLGQFGFDSQWSFYRIWEVHNSLWNIDGLKHTVQPVVQYRYMPAAGAHSSEIPNIQNHVFDTNLRPTDFFYMADVDNLSSMNLIRLGLKQSLQTRNATTGQFPTRDLITLELYQDYNFTDTTDHPHWDSFYILAEANPCDWISFGVFGRANFDLGIWQEHRMYMTLKDADYRTLTLGTRFLRNDIEQYNVIFTQRLTDRVTLFLDTTYDAQLKDFSDLFWGVSQRLRSGWQAQYGIERHTNDTRNASTQFTFRFRWINF